MVGVVVTLGWCTAHHALFVPLEYGPAPCIVPGIVVAALEGCKLGVFRALLTTT